MPRARPPDGRCLANATSSLFPFLAPRAVVESPFPRAQSRWAPGTAGNISAEKNSIDRGGSTRASDSRLYAQPASTCPISPLRTCCGPQGVRGAPRLRATNPRLSQYADISTIVRSQVRNYATTRAERRARNVSHKALRKFRVEPRKERAVGLTKTHEIGFNISLVPARQYFGKQRARSDKSGGRIIQTMRRKAKEPKKNTQDGCGSEGIGFERKSPCQIHVPLSRDKTGNAPIASEAVLTDSRRRKALKRTTAVFQRYMSKRESTGRTILALDGQYRSLTRRLLNYRRIGPDSYFTGVQGADLTPRDILMWGLAALDRRVYPGVRRSSHSLELRHDQRCNDWITRLWQGVEIGGDERLYQNWMDMGPELQMESWHLILLDLLDRRPLRALRFLKVLGQTLPSSHAIFLADAFEHLARRYTSNLLGGQGSEKTKPYSASAWKTNQLGSGARKDFLTTFWQVIGPHLGRKKHLCSQDLLLNIARLATIDDLKVVFDQMVEKKVCILFHTLLSYSNIFAKNGEHQYALRCLNLIVEKMPNLASEHTVGNKMFAWSCALILRRSLQDRDSYHMTSSIVAEFLRFGVRLDTSLYNVVMQNAMDAKDHATAFNVYNLLKREGLKPDEYTYNIMLHGCTLQDDPVVFNDFAEHCRHKALELRDPYLATNCLFYTARISSHDTFNAATERKMLDMYWNLFQSSPLTPFLGSSPSLREGLLPPTIPAVFMVLQAMIRNASNTSNDSVWHMYQYFIRIIQEGKHPVLNELSKGTYIWNAFLLAFCNGQQFGNASHLIKMLSESKDPILKLPKPDITSWNIFLAAFFKTEQLEAAERVFDIMRSRGIEPDQFTYSTLVLGYARAQHLGKVSQVLPYLDQKVTLAPMLLSALAKMQQRGDLMRRLEETRVLREQDEQRKANDKKRELEERWTLQPNKYTIRFYKASPKKKVPIVPRATSTTDTPELSQNIYNGSSTPQVDKPLSIEKQEDGWNPSVSAGLQRRRMKERRTRRT